MERYIRSIFNFVFFIPLIFSWGLMIKNSYFKTTRVQLPITLSAAKITPPVDRALAIQVEPPKPIEATESTEAAKSTLAADTATNVASDPTAKSTELAEQAKEEPIFNERVHEDVIAKQIEKVQEHLKKLASFDRENVAASKSLPKKGTEIAKALPVGESAPDYDETLVELSEHIKNEHPLVSKYVNAMFSKNIMRSLKDNEQRGIAIKAEALLANGPKGIFISPNNLRFLEDTFSRFKNRYGLSRVILSSPEGSNEDYNRKISKFAMNYFNNSLETENDHQLAEGFEIILIGDQ